MCLKSFPRPESKPGWLLRWDGTTLVFEASVIHLHEGYVWICDMWYEYMRTLSVELYKKVKGKHIAPPISGFRVTFESS